MGFAISRRGPAVVFNSLATTIVELPKQNFLREIGIRLTGAPTVTAINNTVANTKRGDEWACVRKVRIVANSSEVLFEMTGNDLWMLNYHMIGTFPQITVGLGDGATADPAFDSVLIVPIWAYRLARPSDAIFHTGMVNNLRLEIDWGTFTDINGAATAWATNPAIELQLEEVEPSNFKPPFRSRMVKQTVVVGGASPAQRINLDIGPGYRGFLLNTTNSAGDTDSSAIITNAKLVSGSKVLREYSAPMLWQLAQLRGDAPIPNAFASTGIASRQVGRISAKNDIRAWYNVNLCLDGYGAEAVASSTFNEMYLELVTSGAGIVNVIQQQLFSNN